MRYPTLVLAVTLCNLPAFAQGNDAESQAAQEQARKGEVQIGAGSTSNVTTGSSAAQKSDAEPKTAEPVSTSMPHPKTSGPFGRREPLPVMEPVALRCDIIADGYARARCEDNRKNLPASR